jgi:hypothetical protein
VAHAAPLGRRTRRRSSLALPFVLCVALALLAVGSMAYMLWPRWPEPVAINAPSLPITIGGVTFNVQPAAMRVAIQRRPGTQERIDLAYLWPSLSPPEPAVRGTQPATQGDRVLITVATTTGMLPATDRLKVIYPRYAATEPIVRADGLAGFAFRDGTPYQGEDLFYDNGDPERFLVRCTRTQGESPGSCLQERRIGSADLTFRFPRDWLASWRDVIRGIDQLIANLKPAAG